MIQLPILYKRDVTPKSQKEPDEINYNWDTMGMTPPRGYENINKVKRVYEYRWEMDFIAPFAVTRLTSVIDEEFLNQGAKTFIIIDEYGFHTSIDKEELAVAITSFMQGVDVEFKGEVKDEE